MKLPLWRRGQKQELAEELRAHLEAAVRERMERGESRAEAEAAARREFGNVDLVAEVTRDAWGWAWLDQCAQDVRYGLRQLRRHPGFTAVAVLTLALGIGSTTAIFSFADALLFRPLPVHRPDRLVTAFHVTWDSGHSSFSLPDYQELRDRNSVLSGLAAYSAIDLDLGSGGQTERIAGEIVSGNYFSVLGVEPPLGRGFLPEEDTTPGTHPVVVISHGLWQRRFGADPAMPGKPVTLNGHLFTVIGVAPRGFQGAEVSSRPDLWVPLMMHAQAMPGFRAFGTELFGNRGTHWLNLVGRLRPSASLAQAQQAMRVIAEWQAEAYPETNRGWSVLLVPTNDARLGSPTGGTVERLTKLLLAVTVIVLLIACANVANLLLAKSVTRRLEMGIRMGLGAGRVRLIRQMITESVLLSLVGGLGGVLLAAWGTSLLATFEVTALHPGLDVRLDSRVLGFALFLSLLTGILFGLPPALQSSGVTYQTLKERGTAMRMRLGWFSGRHVLVTGQVALCLVLLVGAGLILRTLQNLRNLPLGFDPNQLHLAKVNLSSLRWGPAATLSRGRTGDDEKGRVAYRELMEGVQALPGVQSASLGFTTPFGGWRMANDIFLENGEKVNLDMNVVDPTYFQTMGIPLLRGRSFSEDDRESAPRVAVVNEATARRLWPGEEALGKRFRQYDPQGPGPQAEVVGVVKNGRYMRGWRGSVPQPFLFLPFSQQYMASMTLHIRSRAPAATLLHGVTSELHKLDPRLTVQTFTTVHDARAQSILRERMSAKLLSLFGGLALMLAAIGIYGVVSFSVKQRTHEIGVRMALGARKLDILRLVTRQSATPVLLGAGIGIGVALGLTRYMASILFGVRPTDLATFVAATIGLIAVALAATYLPARRAARVDPMTALRHE